MPPRARRITDSFNAIHQTQVIYAIQQAPPLNSNDGETRLNTRIRAHFKGMNASIGRTNTSDAISISSDEEEPATTAAASDCVSENGPPPPVPPRSTRPASKSKAKEPDSSSASSAVPAGSPFAVSDVGPSPQTPTGDLTAHDSTGEGKGKGKQPALPSALSTPRISSEPPVINPDSEEIDRMLALRLQAALFGEDEPELVTYQNEDLGYRVKYRSEHRDQPQAGPSNVECSYRPVREENRSQARVQSPASEASPRVQPRVPAHPAHSSQSTVSTRSSITSTSTSRANPGISTRSRPTSSSFTQAPPTSQAQAQRSSQAQAHRSYQAQATVSSQAQPLFQAPPVTFSQAAPAVSSQAQAPLAVPSQPQASPVVSSQPHVPQPQQSGLPQVQSFASIAASQPPNPGHNHFYPQGTAMPIPRKVKFYAVTRGLRVGVFDSWNDVAAVTQGWNAVFKSYSTFGEALDRYESAKAHGMVHRIDPITRNWILVSAMKKKANEQPEASTSRPTKKPKKGAFRLAKDPSAKPVIATTLHKRSSGQLGHRRANAAVPAPSTPEATLHVPHYGEVDIQMSELDGSSAESPIIGSNLDEPGVETTRRKRINTTSSKLKEWLAFRQSCLDEIIRLNGKGDHSVEFCTSCGSETALYRCRACMGRCILYCQQCMVERHQFLPLHRIEEWNGKFFERTTLKELGLRVQLGHAGGKCPNPVEGPSTFIVFDLSGVHELSVDFCDCRQQGILHRRTQALRFGWLPASYERPKTAFTFDVLDLFHELTLQGKSNVYDFYHTLLRITDNLRLGKITYRYTEFHRAVRVWRHLKSLKWSGCGHAPDGPSSTTEGGLALECPACPHPGKNLPANWRDAPLPLQFLYTLFIAVDANFKLKSKARGLNDLELAPGWSYYVENNRYQEHLANYVDQPEINTCRSEHTAVVRANCSAPGYSINGAGLAICARHSMIRANGAADLTKGEKYCSMDYLILSALIGITVLRVLISYDIACQWAKNLRKRIQEYGPELQLPPEINIETGIPSWHVNGHGEYCRCNLSLSYLPGVGRTCGEDVETTWASTNPLVPSTREMGPSARRETLNHHWGGWNFQKIVGFRQLFTKRFKEAKKLRTKHRETFAQFSSTFAPETLAKWTKMVEDWQQDRSMPNPYQEPFNVASIHDVRLELAKEDSEDAANGVRPAHETTASEFLTKGLELEENQRTLQQEISKFKTRRTSKQNADLQQKRTSLYRRIQSWRIIQIAYMPVVAQLLILSNSLGSETDLPDPQVDQAEKIPLYMPSALPPDSLSNSAIASIAQKECRLRVAQADQALADIRRGRRILTGYSQFKKLNVSGTGNKPNTRMRSMYNRMQSKVERAAQRYRAAYSILLRLDPGGTWKDRFRKLENADIRGPGKEDDDSNPLYSSNGRYEPSWIWLVARSTSSRDPESTDDVFDGSLRTEWTKSMARRDRWEEEYLLVQEEMRRVIAYLVWKASWWRAQAGRRKVEDFALAEGLSAYAEKQAANWEKLAESCALHWVPVLMADGITPDWAEPYPAVVAFARRTLSQAQSIPQISNLSLREAEHNHDLEHEEDNFLFDDDGLGDTQEDGEQEDEHEDDQDDFDMYDFEL